MVLTDVREHRPFTDLPAGGLPLVSIEDPSGHLDFSLGLVVSNADLRRTADRLEGVLQYAELIPFPPAQLPRKIAGLVARVGENVQDMEHPGVRQRVGAEEDFGATRKVHEAASQRAFVRFTVERLG